MKENNSDLMEKIVSLCKRRGFIYPGSEIYGGLAGTFDYGPLGVALKNNLKKIWWRRFVEDRDDMYGIDSAILMNQEVWKASGHIGGFSDPLVECKKCKRRFRADYLAQTSADLSRTREDKEKCPECDGNLGEERQFNMMFKTHIGATEDETSVSYLRPETAGGMFVNFRNILDSFHSKLPFGMAQIGKVFRNEIAPRDFVFRSREFEQMEIEYFVKEDEWQKYFEEFRLEMKEWIKEIGLDSKNVYEIEVPDGERAHYSKRTIDFEFDFPFGQKELYGLAYRTDFDLKAHMDGSKKDLSYFDEASKERIIPHCIEPSFGVDRTILAILTEAYKEDEMNGEKREYLALAKNVAPVKVAVFPLLKNKPDLVAKAREIWRMLKNEMSGVVFDDNGNIGKRYRRQDEIGTFLTTTIDFETLENNTVTLRNRDTAKQIRIKGEDLTETVKRVLNGENLFS